MSTLYERLEFEARKKGKTIYGLCKELEISKGALSNLKSGISKSLSTKTLNKFADALGVSINYLVNGTDDENEPTVDDIEFSLYNGLEQMSTEEGKQKAIEIATKLLNMFKD